MKADPPRERLLQGVGVSPGVAVGVAYVIGDDRRPPTLECAVAPDAVEDEIQRLQGALDRSVSQLKRLRARLDKAKRRRPPDAQGADGQGSGGQGSDGQGSGREDEDIGLLMEAHIHILGDSRLTREALGRIRRDRVNAEAAIHAALAALSDKYQKIKDSYLRSRVSELRDAAQRVLHNLSDRNGEPVERDAIDQAPAGSILIAESLTPAETALLDPQRIEGVATGLGGAQDHSAIMARSLGIPAAMRVPDLISRIHPGQRLVMDGATGAIILDPGPETLARHRRLRRAIAAAAVAARRDSHFPAETRDGVAIALHGNVDTPRDAGKIRDCGGVGVGLMRTELAFMNRSDLPDEDEQFAVMREALNAFPGAPFAIRTLDIGSDKLGDAVDRLADPHDNSSLGLRAIRLGLRRRDILSVQLRAILRLAAAPSGCGIRILLPMVSRMGEVAAVRSLIADAIDDLARQGKPHPSRPPPLGAMIEIPAAAINADGLAQVCDFFSIGTNDLTMYALAVDRNNERVADLYDPLHPAVLRLIAMTVDASRRCEIDVNLCGEIAGDARLTPLLIGMGLRELSMAPAFMPAVRERIRSLAMPEAQNLARKVLKFGKAADIAQALDGFNRNAGFPSPLPPVMP